MAVEFISSAIPKICDHAGAQTYSPGIEVRFKKKKKKKADAIQNALSPRTMLRSFTSQLHNDGVPFISYI